MLPRGASRAARRQAGSSPTGRTSASESATCVGGRSRVRMVAGFRQLKARTDGSSEALRPPPAAMAEHLIDFEPEALTFRVVFTQNGTPPRLLVGTAAKSEEEIVGRGASVRERPDNRWHRFIVVRWAVRGQPA